MFKPCGHCGHKNLLIAHFCAQCGCPFDQPGQRPVQRRASHTRIGAGWLLLIVPLCLFVVSTRATWHSPFWRSKVQETRKYELATVKAEALHDLLAPRKVRVLVGKVKGGTRVDGTRQELEILDRFVALIGRVGCQHQRCIQAHMKKARPTWTTRRSYQLPPRQAEALYRILAFDDVPVGVSKRKSQVRVTASEQDQKTIGRLVNLLRGCRSP